MNLGADKDGKKMCLLLFVFSLVKTDNVQVFKASNTSQIVVGILCAVFKAKDTQMFKTSNILQIVVAI